MSTSYDCEGLRQHVMPQPTHLWRSQSQFPSPNTDTEGKCSRNREQACEIVISVMISIGFTKNRNFNVDFNNCNITRNFPKITITPVPFHTFITVAFLKFQNGVYLTENSYDWPIVWWIRYDSRCSHFNTIQANRRTSIYVYDVCRHGWHAQKFNHSQI